jgi:hypothetical protein
MRAKLDENVPIEAAELLRAADWECDTVYDEGLARQDLPGLTCRALTVRAVSVSSNAHF